MNDINKKIVIIGLGLIGGSLAKALKSKSYKIIGIDKNKETLKQAKKEKVIVKGSTKLNEKILQNVDVIFIATPLPLIFTYLKEISKLKLKKEIIITDVGSTKSEICKIAKRLFPLYRSTALPLYHSFIGGHPMAGTENSGYKHSQKDLFKNKAWVLTPALKDPHTKTSIQILKKIIADTGAKIIITDPKSHDKAACLISHLPLLLAIGLCETLKNTKDKKIKKLAMKMTSSGFKDMTRIARGNSQLSSNMLTSNLKEVKNQLKRFTKEINHLVNAF